MRKILLNLLFIIIFAISLIGCETDQTDIATNKDDESETIVEEKTYNYDDLQKIFLLISKDTTPQELENYILEYELYYTLREYNQFSNSGKEHTYKIAYTEGASKQKHADSGDYLKVSFDNGNNDKLKTAYYSNVDSSYSGLLYNYGTWYDFSDNNAEDYSGYYINNPFGDKEGIIIKYTNGNETETNYFKFNTAEEVIKTIIDDLDNE